MVDSIRDEPLVIELDFELTVKFGTSHTKYAVTKRRQQQKNGGKS